MNVSIITAAFRAENMDRVWRSIKGQIHKDWEWIIVNDNQEEIRKWYKNFQLTEDYIKNKDRIHFVDIQFNKGRFGLYSRNVGAILSNYKHVCFPGRTLVEVKGGAKLIKDIKVGDLVKTHNGNFCKVKK